ncbi:glycoside hydrolase family 3 protein [soil metagenome]
MAGHRGSHSAPERRRWGKIVAPLVALVVLAAAGFVWNDRRDDAARVVPTGAASKTPATEVAPAQPTWGPTTEQVNEATKIAAGLTREELAGQLIIARNTSNAASLALVRDKHFAGVLVTSPQIREVTTTDPLSDVVAYNKELLAIGDQRGVPVMVPIDQEGGLVTRLRSPLSQFPTAMTYGAVMAGSAPDPAQVVADASKAAGSELRALGYNTVFAPVGDITSGESDPNIGSRSTGSDPQTTAAAVVALDRGYRDAGIISTVKHFPGNGTLRKDSHVGLPMQHKSMDALRSSDYQPFEEAIKAGAPSIMMGHVELPEIEPKVPASMSRAVVTGELRERLGYQGLVVSDSLGMGAVIKRYPRGRAAVQAIIAGNDLALMPADNDEAYEAMVEALTSGELPEKQARASAARTIALLLWTKASSAGESAPGANEAVSERLSAAAVTIASGSCAPKLTSVRPSGNEEAVATFRTAAEDAGLGLGSGPSIKFIGYGGGAAYGDIVVATDTPYVLARSSAPTKIALYGKTPASMRALVAVLTGKATAPGKLPVAVGDVDRTGC